jgi:hypothetical protein
MAAALLLKGTVGTEPFWLKNDVTGVAYAPLFESKIQQSLMVESRFF